MKKPAFADEDATEFDSMPVNTRQTFKPVRHVMVPTLSLEEDVDYTFRFLTPFREDANFKEKEEGARRKPARVARVLPYTSDGAETREHTLVGGTVLVDTLDREYPGDGYVDRIFTVRKLPKDDAVAYYRYDITEVELAD